MIMYIKGVKKSVDIPENKKQKIKVIVLLHHLKLFYK